jgi:hypothetical protein
MAFAAGGRPFDRRALERLHGCGIDLPGGPRERNPRPT